MKKILNYCLLNIHTRLLAIVIVIIFFFIEVTLLSQFIDVWSWVEMFSFVTRMWTKLFINFLIKLFIFFFVGVRYVYFFFVLSKTFKHIKIFLLLGFPINKKSYLFILLFYAKLYVKYKHWDKFLWFNFIILGIWFYAVVYLSIPFRAIVCSFTRDGRPKNRETYEFRLITKIPFVYVNLIEFEFFDDDDNCHYQKILLREMKIIKENKRQVIITCLLFSFIIYLLIFVIYLFFKYIVEC